MAEVITDAPPTEEDSLVMLSAEAWCAPCRQFAPVFHRAAAEHKGDVKFYKVDIDENPDLAAKFDVKSVPTVVRIKDGVAVRVDERRPAPFVKYATSL